ncbi:MAG: type II toxin-antitoxin system HicA family toxin [Chlamydiales bacterium]|nr:type II toxin-antitoxin system HicA family toxin [Chlamydiales bacterium]
MKWYYKGRKHDRTLEAIFKNPVQAGVEWRDCEKLLLSLGAEISEGEGSRVRIVLNGVKAVFHRPHPQKEIDKGALKSLRGFLENAGIRPKEKKS